MQLHAHRDGVAGSHSQGVRCCSLRRSHSAELAGPHLGNVLAGAAVNLVSVAQCLSGTRRARVTPPFLALLMATPYWSIPFILDHIWSAVVGQPPIYALRTPIHSLVGMAPCQRDGLLVQLQGATLGIGGVVAILVVAQARAATRAAPTRLPVGLSQMAALILHYSKPGASITRALVTQGCATVGAATRLEKAWVAPSLGRYRVGLERTGRSVV